MHGEVLYPSEIDVVDPAGVRRQLMNLPWEIWRASKRNRLVCDDLDWPVRKNRRPRVRSQQRA